MTEDLNSLPTEATKQAYRKKVWDYLEKNNLASFPRPVHGRIPNFKGSAEAAEKLSKLDVFKSASCVKVNLDKPQEAVRFLALEAKKSILMLVPRLHSGLFYNVEPPSSGNKRDIRAAAARYGAERFGKACNLDTKIKADLVVLGSVAVSKEGYRIGKGEGFGDLEFAIMMKIGIVEEDTVVVSTTHDCQVFDTLPHELFKEHDVPVDIIVTPTQVIEIFTRLPKPKSILWNIFSNRRLQLMPILQLLRENEISEGNDCTLKEVDSDVEELPQRNRPFVGFSRNRFTRSRFSNDRPRFGNRRPRFSDGRDRFIDGMRSGHRPRSVEERERRLKSEKQLHPQRRPRAERRRSDRSTSGENNTDERRRRSDMPSRTFRRRRRSFNDSNSSQASSEKTHKENSNSNENSASTNIVNSDGNAVNSTHENVTGNKNTEINTQSRGTSPIRNVSLRRYRQQRRLSIRKPDIVFSVRVDNIASTVRVRDLKNALAERNIKPSDITWRGPKGFALLHFAKLGNYTTQNELITVDSIVSSLRNLDITTEEGKSLKVEPAEPVTRIEITDIPSV